MTTTATCPECQRYFDPTDPTDAAEWAYGHDCETPPRVPPPDTEYTYAVHVELDIRATTEDDAFNTLRKILSEGDVSLICDWYIEDMHPYGPEVDDPAPQSPMFRTLPPAEEADFRAWAHTNWNPTDPINILWHPVIRDECQRILAERDRP